MTTVILLLQSVFWLEKIIDKMNKQQLERNKLYLFANWIKQYFVSDLQNYRFSYDIMDIQHDCIVLQFLWKV